MKAIYISETGGPEKLIFGDRPDPEAGTGEVVVRVRASSVNHADLGIRAGRSSTAGLPRILGLDIAGEVARVGPGVTGWKEGDRVVVENRVKCGACAPCVLGRDELCERQKREARVHLRRAADLFHQVGVPPWEERAEAELRATGETARRRDPSTLDQLTPQELQIAGLVASGMTNRQIAAQLYLSPRTIDYHLRKVFTKLDVSSRAELIRFAAQESW